MKLNRKKFMGLVSLALIIFASALAPAARASVMGNVVDTKNRAVVLKALYYGLKPTLDRLNVSVSEAQFTKQMGKVYMAANKIGVLPSSIVLGYFSREQLLVGKQYARQFNFYMEEGKIRVTEYEIDALQVGAAVTLKAGLYAALCFGACAGASGDGTYLGADIDINISPGTDLFLEVGVDTTSYFEDKKIGKKYSIKDLYDSKVFYLGIGIDAGLGGGFSVGFSKYSVTNDTQFLDLERIMNQPQYTDEKLKKASAARFTQAGYFKDALKKLP